MPIKTPQNKVANPTKHYTTTAKQTKLETRKHLQYIPQIMHPVTLSHGPLTRYVKFRVMHAPGMPRTFSLPPRLSDSDMHHDTCVTHVPWCMPGSVPSGFIWSRWRRKRTRHSMRMHNPQCYVSGKRPMFLVVLFQSKWGVLCQKQASRAGRSNYIPKYLWDAVICPCPWYLRLAQHSSILPIFVRIASFALRNSYNVWLKSTTNWLDNYNKTV